MKVLLVLLILSVGLLAQSDGYLGGPSGDLGKPSGDYGKPGSGVGNPPNSPPPASGGTPAFGSPSHQNPYMNQGGGYGRPGHSGGIQHAPHGHGHGGGRR